MRSQQGRAAFSLDQSTAGRPKNTWPVQTRSIKRPPLNLQGRDSHYNSVPPPPPPPPEQEFTFLTPHSTPLSFHRPGGAGGAGKNQENRKKKKRKKKIKSDVRHTDLSLCLHTTPPWEDLFNGGGPRWPDQASSRLRQKGPTGGLGGRGSWIYLARRRPLAWDPNLIRGSMKGLVISHAHA